MGIKKESWSEISAVPAIVCNKVCLRAKKKEILHEVSFEVVRGSITGLLGPNGAGKSSIMRMIAGLSEPHSRITLIYAKALAYLRLGVTTLIMEILVCASHYLIAVRLGQMQSIPLRELFASVAADAAFILAILPVMIASSLTVLAMQSGWARVAILPFLIMLMAPLGMIGFLYAMLDINDPLDLFLSPIPVLLTSAGIVLFGWALAYLLLQLTAKVGMKRLGDIRHRIKSEAVDTQVVLINQGSSRFLSLYRLERTRFIHFRSLRPVRLTSYAILVGVAVGAYFCLKSNEAMIEFPWVLFMLPMLGATIFSMNLNNYELQKKRLHWWLGFPYSRSLLIFTRNAAIWVMTIRYFIALSIAFWLGAAVGLIVHPAESSGIGSQMIWYAYTALLFIAALTITLGLLQVSNYLMKNSGLAMLTFPLYVFVMVEPHIIHGLLYPKSYDISGILPDWLSIWLIYLLGIPFAALCLVFGAKHLHVVLKHESAPQWARNIK